MAITLLAEVNPTSKNGHPKLDDTKGKEHHSAVIGETYEGIITCSCETKTGDVTSCNADVLAAYN